MILDGFIICNNNTKEEIIRNTQGFNDYTFLTEGELIKRLYGDYSPEAILYLMDKYDLSYEVSKEYLSYMPYLSKDGYNDIKLDSILTAKNALIKEGLYRIDELFKIRLRQYPVTIIDFTNKTLLAEVVSKISEYTTVQIYENKHNTYIPKVYSLKTITDECIFIMDSVRKLYNSGVSLNNIYLLNMNGDYEFILKRLEREYGLPISFPKERGILGFNIVNDFLEGCRTLDSFDEIMEALDHTDDYYKPILDQIIKYNLKYKNPKDYIGFLKCIFNEMPIEAPKYQEMLQTREKEYYSNKDYIFFMNANLGATPKIYKDEEYLNDSLLTKINLLTSVEKNKEAKDKIIRLFTTNKNIVITYKEIFGKDTCLPANIIKELGLTVEPKLNPLGGNEVEDRIRLGVATTKYMKYKAKSADLALKADIRYNRFDNSFKGVSKELLDLKFAEKPLKLAYSNLKTYYSCPFNYYLDKILDLNEYKSTSSTRLGSFAHQVLENSYNEGFSLDEAAAQAIIDNKDEEEEYKDYFYMSQMKGVLKDLIDFNLEHEALSKLDNVKRELDLEYIGEGFSFIGFIDKLLYTEINGEIYCAIIDYKTGSDIVSLDNVEDGFNLQLPVYMFLLRSYPNFKDKPIHILGIYLQKVNIIALDNTIDILDQRKKAFKLRGYTIKDLPKIVLLDPDFNKSSYIQSMMLTKDGAFGRYAKVITREEEDKLLEIVEGLINKAATNIHNGVFPIAPKRIDGKDKSCTFCKYKDICYKRFLDYVDLEPKPFKEEEE